MRISDLSSDVCSSDLSMKLAFEREHLAELRALGLLPQEVESLQRALPALAELLLPPVAMDARRDVLKNLHAALSTAETLVATIEAAPAPDVGLVRTAYETVWRSIALDLAPAYDIGRASLRESVCHFV